MCDLESSRVLWSPAGGSSGFVLCAATDAQGFLIWRVLREGRDGVAVVDRTYNSGRDLIADWFRPLVQGEHDVVDAFRAAVERYPGLRDCWRDYVRRLLS